MHFNISALALQRIYDIDRSPYPSETLHKLLTLPYSMNSQDGSFSYMHMSAVINAGR